ncbi:hypothetical protein [Methylomonas methanica]|uniref:Uncharacterized protein n=1 Tax=Methylomonas methanica TaxID=421 RepID=A0A177M2D8_METMH|nr:hypothetical protein [Methylomonas methanica]OAH99703.1 hypothetical protein A1332_19520 [Methylomonas methanica]
MSIGIPKPRIRTENISGGTAESFGFAPPGYRDIHKLLGRTPQSPVRTAACLVGTSAGIGCTGAPLGGNHEGVLRAALTLGNRPDPVLITHQFDWSLPPTPAGMNSTGN